MGDASILIGIQHQLERFNASFGFDLGRYAAPFMFAYLAANFVPTLIGMLRGTAGLRRLALLNAAAPAALLLLGPLSEALALPDKVEGGVFALAIATGMYLWVWTMLDVVFAPAAGRSETAPD